MSSGAKPRSRRPHKPKAEPSPRVGLPFRRFDPQFPIDSKTRKIAGEEMPMRFKIAILCTVAMAASACQTRTSVPEYQVSRDSLFYLMQSGAGSVSVGEIGD